MTDVTLSRARGVYPDLESARDAARRVPRGFVVTSSPSRHVVYEGRWQPYVHGSFSVDVEPGPWTIIVAGGNGEALLLDLGAARWLATTGLPAAIAMVDRLGSEHESRAGDLRWSEKFRQPGVRES